MSEDYIHPAFYPPAISQKELLEKYLPVIAGYGRLNQKVKGVHARIAQGGERIVTITADGIETADMASGGDYIVRNETEGGEEYILKPEKFKDRYELERDDYYIPNDRARVIALQVTEDNIYRYKLREMEDLVRNPALYFFIEAPWLESQKLQLNDYLVCNLDKNEVYRIARKEFTETYREIQPNS